MTQSDLAAAVRAGQGTVSKYEGGVLVPPPEFVSDLSGALGYPESFFFQPGHPYGFPPFHYRKRKKLSAKALGKIVAEMNIRRMHIAALLRSFPVQTNHFIPEIDPDEFRGRTKRHPSIEEFARSVREMWMLPNGPIPNMVDLIEENGGIIVPCDFGSDLIDAMSQRIDGMPALFFVNMHAPADRVRHTLAHELAHMILHTTTLKDDDEMEREADEFAGAFMLPADEIRPQLRRFDLRQLANMKAHWKVSMQSIAYRADKLKLITPYQAKMFWIEMSKLGYRKREPVDLPRETPSLLRRMVAFHTKTLGYSTDQMATLLQMTPPEFVSIYGGGAPPERPKLRLVT